jgi:hypothetical protein
MNIRGRLDRLEEQLGTGRLWDGSTAKDLVECGYLTPGADLDPATHRGVHRLATYLGLCGVLHAIAESRRPLDSGDDPGEIRADLVRAMDMLDLPLNADDDAIEARVLDIGMGTGFYSREMDMLRDSGAEFLAPEARFHACLTH